MKIADAYSIPYFEIKNNNQIDKVLNDFFEFDGPCFCQVFTDPDESFEPKVIAKMDENGRFIPGRLSEAQWN
jgi:acetolactate synthase-1/2/3 large subunit